MEQKKEYWTTTDELLDEANRTVFIEVDYNGKLIRLAWKEISEGVELDVELPDKPIEEMNKDEQAKYNMLILGAEALARIMSAGEQEGCFNKNVITKDIWDKFPPRIRALILNEMFQLTKVREERFQ